MAKELELPQQTLKKQTPQALALTRKSSDTGLSAPPLLLYPAFSSCLPVAGTHNLAPFFGTLYSLFSPLKCNLQKEAFPEHPNLKWPSNPFLFELLSSSACLIISSSWVIVVISLPYQGVRFL